MTAVNVMEPALGGVMLDAVASRFESIYYDVLDLVHSAQTGSVMEEPRVPDDEGQRIEWLQSLQILDTASEDRFDRITRTASRTFGVPIALVSLVDVNRQWFKSCVGLPVSETPRGISFCGHAILQSSVFVIENALEDKRFADNPLVTGEPNIRFYAGVPLRGPEGFAAGTLCIIDRKPRIFTDEDNQTLVDLGSWAEAELNGISLERTVRLEQGLSAFFSVSPDFMCTVNKEGYFVDFNNTFEKELNYSPDELRSRPFLGFVHPSDLSGTEQAFQRVLAGEQLSSFDVRFLTQDKVPIWLEWSAALSERTNTIYAVGRDVGAQRAAERSLAISEARWRSLIDNSPTLILIIDRQGRITFVNRRGQQPGQGPRSRRYEDLVGAHIYDFARDEGRDELRAAVDAAFSQGKMVSLQVPGYGLGDQRVWYSARIAPMEEALGTFRAEIFVEDITDRIQMEKMKDEFVSMISHELRTPLTSIRGALGLVTSGRLEANSDEAQKMLTIASSNATRLAALVDDILDVERIVAGRITLEREMVGVAPLLKTAADSLRPLANEKQISLSTGRSQTKVWADPSRVQQVLVNLIGNAIKFSPEGSAIQLRAQKEAEAVAFSVKDEGRGIPSDDLHRIFERFHQVDAPQTSQRGTGLGLWISKEIVEMHGGRIWVESAVGEGSTFFFTLPISSQGGTDD